VFTTRRYGVISVQKNQSIVFVMFICIENIWVINEQNFMSLNLLSWDRKLC